MPLNLFYTMVQKSQKWPKTQIKGVLPQGVQRHYYRVGSHLKFQTAQNETFQSVPELSGTYRSSFDVKSISSMTS